jgi:lipoyl(octanoyl) transferase
MPDRTLIIRQLGQREYLPTWQAMRDFTDRRDESTPSELWVVEHPPVFTQGQAGKAEHLLGTGDVPVVQTDRGGQVTYHGPGQLVIYLLISLREAGVGIRGLVSIMENAIIELLAAHGIEAAARTDAPGVYVAGSKVASLGLRVRRGCTYHGLALNVSNDLEPFQRINPCGHAGLEVTSTSLLGIDQGQTQLAGELVRLLCRHLRYRPAGG